MGVESYKLRIGGLLRCCTQSLADAMAEATEEPKEGDHVDCKWCKGEGMRFRDGAWEWAREPSARSGGQ